MTEIIDLELSGVRSFTKNSENESQVIKFSDPVTIITGDNGTGKTTIIEALKFALTGKSSREIVTDPKFWLDEEVKSKIVLKIKSCNNKSYSIQLNPFIKENKRKKAKATTYSSGSVKVRPLSGSSDTVFGLQEYQRWIEPKLGVSLSIIENVIFCSQNDSCWPIDLHGDDLKNKFDLFFDLKKYDKALDLIHDNITGLNKDNEKLENKLNELKPKVDIYLKIKREAIDIENQIESINNDLAKINDRINILEEGKAIISKINFLQEQIDKLLPKELRNLLDSRELEDDTESFLNSFQKVFDESNDKIEKLESEYQQKQATIKKIEDLKKFEEQFEKSVENAQNFLFLIQEKIQDCEITEENFDEKVSALESNYANEKKLLDERKCKVNGKLILAQKDFSNYTNLLSIHEKESKDIEEEICKILHPKEDESYFDAYEIRKKSLNEEKVDLQKKKSKIDVYINFKRKAEKCHCCPLCKQSLNSEKESILIDKLDKYISSLQETMEMCQLNEKNIEDLLKIKSKVEKYENSQKDRNGLEMNIELYKEKVGKRTNKFEEIERSIIDVDKNLKNINLVNQNVILLKQELKNKKNCFDEKEKIKFEIGDFDSDSLETLKSEVYELNLQIKELKSTQFTKNQFDEYKKIKLNMNEEYSKLLLYRDQFMSLGIDISRDDYDIDNLEHITNNFNIQRAISLEKLESDKQSLNKVSSYMEKYSGSVLEHNKHIIKYELQKKSIYDLKRYKDHLERFLFDYHVKKIQEINDSIYYLWSRIYQGSDITSIKIDYREKQRDEVADEKKKYDYLVIMTKDNVDLDMFNRCSSGQKMLASIIIRIALAQTFCARCGIIALDEPTTNLDKKNRKELASQLVEIANLKMEEDDEEKKKSFQLIIISHNEKFVEPIRNELGLSQYYHLKSEIDENKHHFSKIEVKKF